MKPQTFAMLLVVFLIILTQFPRNNIMATIPATVSTTQPAEDQDVDVPGRPRFGVTLLAENERPTMDHGQIFAVRVSNHNDDDAKLVDDAEVKLTYRKDRSAVEVGQDLPVEILGPSKHVMHVRLQIESPEARDDLESGTFLTMKNGMIEVKELKASDEQYIGIVVNQYAFKRAGKYRITAILLDGDAEIARSRTHEIVVAP